MWISGGWIEELLIKLIYEFASVPRAGGLTKLGLARGPAPVLAASRDTHTRAYQVIPPIDSSS
ncbi:hypothetical protein N7457_006073 [Penicillium paradoxum]|uniref:uncharacterized protein n=1 Tax=Penicillium paradoxum TaxID=176176 RepID=UPI0025497E8D|nr:uncharacterized protein N7457_006073 [Penicillium paradoxum]KAJ5780913.1 hypothetical protein N7457_006073 [Penicillium paradoxum]